MISQKLSGATSAKVLPGITWRTVTSPVASTVWRGVAWSGSKYMIVGTSGRNATSSDGGNSWVNGTSVTSPAGTLTTVTYGTQWSSFRTSNNVTQTSNSTNDGVTWATVSTGWPVAAGAEASSVSDVHANGSTVVAVGRSGADDNSDITWARSTNGGNSWINQVGLPGVIEGVTYSLDLSMWLFVGRPFDPGRAIIMTSIDDGVTLSNVSTTPTFADPTRLNSACWGNGLFVAVGAAGLIATSSIGTGSWTVRTSGTTNELYGVVWANGLFIAVGAGGTIRTSPTGITWTTRSSGSTEILYGVASSGTTAVIVGANSTILVSG